MAPETVTIGDTDVEIRETEDGFEAVEATDPAEDPSTHEELLEYLHDRYGEGPAHISTAHPNGEGVYTTCAVDLPGGWEWEEGGAGYVVRAEDDDPDPRTFRVARGVSSGWAAGRATVQHDPRLGSSGGVIAEDEVGKSAICTRWSSHTVSDRSDKDEHVEEYEIGLDVFGEEGEGDEPEGPFVEFATRGGGFGGIVPLGADYHVSSKSPSDGYRVAWRSEDDVSSSGRGNGSTSVYDDVEAADEEVHDQHAFLHDIHIIDSVDDAEHLS